MFREEKKKNTNYGSILIYCLFCFVFIVEVVREIEAVVGEGFSDVDNSRSCSAGSVPARNHQKVSGTMIFYRDRPPTSYCVKFDPFNTMSRTFESQPFSSGNYSWTFLIYPTGRKPEAGDGYLSVYARINQSSLIDNPKDVYAEIKFYVYRKTMDQYYTYQETEAQRFNWVKPQWGVPNFLPISYFHDPGLGFIFDYGQSIFGIDVFVAQPCQKWEVFPPQKNIGDPVFDWNLTGFSLSENNYTSALFSYGGINWFLKLYPNGVGSGTNNSLSLFLLSASNESGYMRAKLSILDQVGSTHVEKRVEGLLNAKENGWGFEKFIPIGDIKNVTKGFLVNHTLKLEAEVLPFSKTDSI